MIQALKQLALCMCYQSVARPKQRRCAPATQLGIPEDLTSRTLVLSRAQVTVGGSERVLHQGLFSASADACIRASVCQL